MTGEGTAASDAGWPLRVAAGFRVGRWTVERPIAAGSWGCVYAGTGSEGPVALKFLPPAGLTPRRAAEIAERERRLASALRHPRLVRVLEVTAVQAPDEPRLHGAVVLVMEQAAGTLAEAIAAATDGGPVAQAPRLLAEVAEGIAALHQRGFVHGDLKPSNVLLTEDGSVRLADFGLTAELDGGTHGYAPPAGSPDFLPPEWFSERPTVAGMRVRPAQDVWAFGVLAHLVLAGGRHPFPGAGPRARSLAAVAYAEGREEFRPAQLPPGWAELVAACLTPSPRRRAALAGEALARSVRTLADGAPAAGGAAAASGPRRGPLRRMPRLVAAVACCTVAAGAGPAQLQSATVRPGASAAAVPIVVRNVDPACARLGFPRSPFCHLGLARDPRAEYIRSNVVGYVWQGDRLRARCRIDDGREIQDELGRAGSRWYLVDWPSAPAWLPALRADRAPAVPRC